MTYYSAIPAYGRDYTSKAKVMEDWRAGKDFIIQSMDPNDGRAVNIADKPAGVTLNIRYKRLTQVCVVK
jgi:hypothetical protein